MGLSIDIPNVFDLVKQFFLGHDNLVMGSHNNGGLGSVIAQGGQQVRGLHQENGAVEG